MEKDVRQRIREFISKTGTSLNAISKSTNYPQSNLNKQINGETSISANTLIVLLDYFQDLSSEWLLRGKGEMLTTEKSESSAKAQSSISDHQDHNCEIERLKTLVARLEGQNDLLREQLGLPETIKVKSVS